MQMGQAHRKPFSCMCQAPFLLVTQIDAFSLIQAESFKENSFAADFYMNKILRAAIITTSSSNFIKCLQKTKRKYRGQKVFKQKAQ